MFYYKRCYVPLLSQYYQYQFQEMFPNTTKYRKPMINLQTKDRSPKERLQINKSTHLPYFKRFPNSKFQSVQRKRANLVGASPQQKHMRFFTEEKQQMQKQQTSFNKVFSSSIIKNKSPKIRQRLIKQVYERQSTKIRRASEISVEKPKALLNSSTTNHTISYITPQHLFRIKNNLTDYQIEEIIEFDQIYYYGQLCTQKKFKKNNISQLNKQELYPWGKGDHINYRYQVIEVLGQGSFGQVFKCLDHKYAKAPTAVKIVKYNEKYNEQARSQISILSLIKKKDPANTKNCIQIKDYFIFRKRVCMTFDLLSVNLYELIKSNGYYGLPLDLIRRFVLQILNAVYFLHKSNVIHADLKPQNILLKQPNKSGIRVIDFGSSCFETNTIYTYIQSRYYRAPEVILGMGYDRKIDIWSFGCIIAELHLGYPLFAGEDQHQQMCLLIQVLGMPPRQMSHNAKRWNVFFDIHGNLKDHQKKVAPGSKALAQALQNPEQKFVQFIRLCLQWNPKKRIDALSLLKEGWVLSGLPQDFKQQHLKFIQQQQQNNQENNSLFLQRHIRTKSKKTSFSIRQKGKNSLGLVN